MGFSFLNENTSLELRSVNEKKIYRFFNNSNKKEDTRIEATRNLWLDFQRYVLFGEKGKLVLFKRCSKYSQVFEMKILIPSGFFQVVHIILELVILCYIKS